MFDIDKWQEIFHTIKKNKLRTFITAFNVAWGIFILIILVGFGTGFQNGVKDQFKDDANNSIWIRPGQTSIAHKGMKPGRNVRFTNGDYDLLKGQIEGIDRITSRFYVSGEFTVRYKNKYSAFNVRSCHPDHLYLENTIMLKGRYLNEKDIIEKRKVTAIGTKVVDVLFGKEDPIGKYIDVNGIKYKVVGTFKDEGGENELKIIYIPISTAQLAYGGGDRVHQMMVTVGDATVEESNAIENEIREMLSEKHIIANNDKRALGIFNMVEEFQKFMNLFGGIKFFLFVVGIFTLVAGVVGVSNIMLIVVKERTKEIGVRKALGATPNSVIGLFLQEAMLITILAGYVGLVAGIAFLELGYLTSLMSVFGFPENFFRDPSVNISWALGATAVLAFCGTLAGYFPARRGARIKPIEALRDQ